MLRVEQVDKHFATVKAVDDLSFDVREGEIFALLGPNGAGKSTTLRLLLGMLRPDRGRILWNLGETERPPNPTEIGFLPEDRGLYQDQPIAKSLAYFGRLRGMSQAAAQRAVTEWLQRFGLGDRAHEKLQALSKGNQQKVQFAAALLHRPRVALLDEPFSGLDPINQDFFIEIIRELRAGGMTILLSAHQMELVERLADRLLLIARGRRVLYGTLAELRLAESAGVRLELLVRGEPRADAWADLKEVLEAQIEAQRVSLLVERGVSLSLLLRRLCERVEIESVHSVNVTLHDLYVRAVRAAEATHFQPDVSPSAEARS